MTPERWHQVKQVFKGAVARDPVERPGYLEEACGDDEGLRAEVESLLRSDGRDATLVDCDLFEVFGQLLAHRPGGESKNRRLGNYRLVREIGRGGMAVVYAAVRDDEQYHQQVAIKLIRRGLDSGRMSARFRQERQILANLEHPHIARLLDGGVTEDDVPYLVMEFVDGEPIDVYCDRRCLTIKQRLTLFRKVCAAVHAAHQSLVVHRDLKPSNILVTGDGVPKLLDFGIAKLLEPEDEPRRVQLTVDGTLPMTPEYASPEQVRGKVVTTASDVYALGVLLYHLLTGNRPYRIENFTRGEIERVICEQEPVRPSTAIRRLAPGTATDQPGPEELSRLRSRSPAELHRILRGDLDKIVMKALEKEPERRYGSAEQFSEDIRRYLLSMPVIARDATFFYRAGKFVRRHRFGVAAAVVLFLSLVGGIVATTVQMRIAQQERLTSQNVSSFLIDLFELSDPEKAQGESITARELLGRSVKKIELLEDEPEVQATLRDTIGRVHLNLGFLDEAEPLLEKALEFRRRELAASDPALADSLANVAELLRARARFAGAERLQREALMLRRRWLPETDERIGESENQLALALLGLGRLDEAEEILRRALARQRRLLGEEHEKIAVTLTNLAWILSEKSKFQEAVEFYRQALAMNEKLLDEEDPQVAVNLSNLATVLCNLGEEEEARLLFERAEALERKVLGEHHPSVALAQNNLASCLRRMGDPVGAEALFRSALELSSTALGSGHPQVALILTNLGKLLFVRGELRKAEDHFRQALAIYRQAPGGPHLNVTGTLNNLAAVLGNRGLLSEAEELYREALATNRLVFGQAHERIANNLNNLGNVLQKQGSLKAAEEFFREALTMRQQLFGNEHRSVGDSHNNLGHLLQTMGRPEEAEIEYRRAAELRRKNLGDGHRDVAVSTLGLGRVLLEQERPEEAVSLLRQALRIWQSEPANRQQPGLAITQSLLGGCLASLESYREAEALLLASFTFLERNHGADHRWTEDARRWLTYLYEKSGRAEAADRYRMSRPS